MNADTFSIRWQQCRWWHAPDFNQSLLEFNIPKWHRTDWGQGCWGHISGEI